MPNERLIIKIGGMTCDHCTKFIHTTITDLPGIEKCTVNLQNNEAQVVFNSDKITRQQIIDEVSDTHFQVLQTQ